MVAAGIAALPRLGGHRALDLVNTVAPRLPVLGRHEHLASPEDLLVCAQRTELLNASEAVRVADAWSASPSSGSEALAVVLRIREALSTILSTLLGVDIAAPEATQATEYLSLRWVAACARTELVLDRPGAPSARLATQFAPATIIADRFAIASIELLTEVDLTHLGVCPPEHGGCGWLYIDQSRTQTRRWCSMDACGAAAKSRRLTDRRRSTRATGLSS